MKKKNYLKMEEEDRTYPALNFISGIYGFLGLLSFLVGIISVILIFAGQLDFSEGIIVFGVSLSSSVILLGFAELIVVLTDISSYTYRLLRHNTKLNK